MAKEDLAVRRGGHLGNLQNWARLLEVPNKKSSILKKGSLGGGGTYHSEIRGNFPKIFEGGGMGSAGEMKSLPL